MVLNYNQVPHSLLLHRPPQKPERTKPKAMPMAIPKEKAQADSQSSVYENDFVPKKPSQNPAKNDEKIKLQDSTKVNFM